MAIFTCRKTSAMAGPGYPCRRATGARAGRSAEPVAEALGPRRFPCGRPAIACLRASLVLEARELPGCERRLARESTAADQHRQPLAGDDRVLQLTQDVLQIGEPIGQGAR